MAEIKLTPSQQAVVKDRGGALLVSAAAGSGKTKVLVDRLLDRICDRDHPYNLDDFLIITYTKAAASELRLKISQAISQRIAENPSDFHLQRQLSRIYLAEISTVHAFCSNLLRTYAHLLDIPADFRVAEEMESTILQDRVLNDMLLRRYEEADQPFLSMVDAFGYGRDDRHLVAAIKMTREQLRRQADMDGWLAEVLDTLNISQYQDVLQTPWGAYLYTEFQRFLSRKITNMNRALEEMASYPNIQKGLDACFRENICQMQVLQQCKTWDSLVQNRILTFGRAGSVRKPEDVLTKERIANVRTNCWHELQKWQDLFFGDSKSILQDLSAVSSGMQALLFFAKEFDLEYGAEKKKRKLMDFSDLEHYAIRLLTDKYTKKPTRTAMEVSGRFAEIMVDEYQDSNEVQETIFEAVSRSGRNRFMVGDVKQSIYRFRLADPTLFLKKYDSYPEYGYAEEGEPRKILLSDNFRSRGEILSACNDVFRLIMRKSVGDLEYTDAEALRQGREYPDLPDPAVELHCLTHSNPSGEKTAMEADYVAARIRKMLDEQMLITDGDTLRPIRPSDIVILMRSVSSTAPEYTAALGRYGVPVVSERGGSLLDTSEVQILMAILQIIDNPHQDVPLLTVLASPVFGFTPDQLAAPRTQNRKDDFFSAIQDDPVFSDFVKMLRLLREDAKWKNLHELLDCVFQRTGMLAVFAAMDDGVRRERNLLAFRSAAVSYENTGSKSLVGFLRYLQDIQLSGGILPVPKGSSENAVSIMTVHSSKGLEFPVVFLCDLSRKFNMQDMQDAILVDRDLAVGCNRVDQQRFVRYPTLAKKAIIHKQTREAVSEELRVLYVAMTRAKDRLIMTYYSRYLRTELKNLNAMLTLPLSDELCESANNPGKWILMAALCRTEAGALFAEAGHNDVSRVWDTQWNIQFHDLVEPDGSKTDLTRMENHSAQLPALHDLDLLVYKYPHRLSCQIPAKMTATQLKGRFQDQEAADGAGGLPQVASYQFRRPRFLTGELSPSEKGTATHLFLQFASYEKCLSEEQIDMELRRLRLEEYLTPEQAEAVNKFQILQFFQSDLGNWLLRQEIKKEFKFSILVSAAEYGFSDSDDQMLLQGVVDCFVLEEDGLTILDFKTDRHPRPEYYRSQLETYGKALSRIYEKPIKQKILHFFVTGDTVYL